MLKRCVLFAFCGIILFVSSAANPRNVPPNKREMTNYTKIFGKSAIKKLIENAGHGYESYNVTTEDGYILNLNRIVNKNKIGNDRGYPLLLLNGFMMHSEAWLMQEQADTNIASVWAKLGYDVWLGDHRGTMRSKGHVNMSISDPKYWDFSFHESGLYDTAAFIDFILEKTTYKDLIFSCISLGCSFHAVLISENPSYNEKIRGAIYFVPLVNNIRKITEMNSFMHMFLMTNINNLNIYEKQGVQHMFPNWGNFRKEMFHVCQISPSFIVALHVLIYGYSIHIPQSNPCYLASLPMGGTNLKSSKHLLQVYETGDFAKYDYGREENVRRYGTELPPLYNMTKITSFVAIYYSDADVFASPKGVEKTRKLLGGKSYGCKMPNFNHIDVATGWNFKYVFPDVIEVLNELSGYKNDTKKLMTGECPSMEWIRKIT